MEPAGGILRPLIPSADADGRYARLRRAGSRLQSTPAACVPNWPPTLLLFNFLG